VRCSVLGAFALGVGCGHDPAQLHDAADTDSTETDALVSIGSPDFIVHDAIAGDQFLTRYSDVSGLQLAADSAGNWTVVFGHTDDGPQAVRFDKTGQRFAPEFATATYDVGGIWSPAVAMAGQTSLALWKYTQPGGAAFRIDCRAIASNGTLSAMEVALSTDDASGIGATSLPDGSSVVVWTSMVSPSITRSAIVGPDCAVIGSVQTLSSASVGSGASRAHAVAAATTILYAWIADGNLWVRTSTLAGILGSETKILDATTTHALEHVRLVTFGSAFAAVVRWRPLSDADGPKLELYRLSTLGAVIGGPIVINEPNTLTAFGQSRAFGVATRPSDGAVLVTWDDCDGASPCAADVYARLIRSDGMLGEVLTVPTTITNRPQYYPSVAALPNAFVVAWNDASFTLPDNSGTAVRARIIAP
jgi:hypothetical protein